MGKPVLLTVDDDKVVTAAIARDLRRRYADEFTVVSADSAASGLDVLRRLRLRGDRPAMLLVDQRMPVMAGVEFLVRTMDVFPDARRVLLTAYADTDAAIRAINEADLHHYLMKPWDPAEERLYPALDDLLDDWRAVDRPPFEGVRLLGHRWSPRAHELRDLLARNHVPYQWLDVEVDREATALLEVAAEPPTIPALVLQDGQVLSAPSNIEALAAVGVAVKAEQPFYDLVIVGGGPAGLAASVYGASEGLRTLLLEREAPGGQAGQSSHIANYLGFPRGISGSELSRRALDQARALGTEVLLGRQVESLATTGSAKNLRLEDGTEVTAHAVILAMGVSYRRLDAACAEELTGAGVFYGAASTEVASTRGEDVYLVGGANAAGQAAVHFAASARSVTILVRGAGLTTTMSRYLVDQLEALPNVRVRAHTRVGAVAGDGHLEEIVVRSELDGSEERLPTGLLFVFIGALPGTEWLEGAVDRDERGFLLTGPAACVGGRWPLERQPFSLETSMPGVLAAGDVRADSMKRVVSAVGEGGVAVHLVHRYLDVVQ